MDTDKTGVRRGREEFAFFGVVSILWDLNILCRYSPEQEESQASDCCPSDIVVHVRNLIKDTFASTRDQLMGYIYLAAHKRHANLLLHFLKF